MKVDNSDHMAAFSLGATMYVIKCHAPSRRPRFNGDRCGGFVARFPYPVRVKGLVEHSDNAGPDSRVCPCRSCGALHELVRVQVEAKLP